MMRQGIGSEVLITNVAEIPLGEGRMFQLGDGEIAVFRTHSGGVHATQAYCPHLGGPLADGLTSASVVVCPLHDRTYDLATGCGLSHEGTPIKVFESRLDADGNVWVVPDTVPGREPIHVGAAAHVHAASESMEIVSSS